MLISRVWVVLQGKRKEDGVAVIPSADGTFQEAFLLSSCGILLPVNAQMGFR